LGRVPIRASVDPKSVRIPLASVHIGTSSYLIVHY